MAQRKKPKLTEEAIRKVAIGEDLWDGELKGFGVRRLEKLTVYRVKTVVSKDGGWSYKFKTLGDTETLSLDEARTQARIAIGALLKEYGDPDRLKRETRARKLTLETALSEYLAYCRTQKRSERTITDYRKTFDRYLADWLDRPMSAVAIDRAGFRKRFLTVIERNGRAAALSMVRVFKAVYRFAATEDITLPSDGPYRAIPRQKKADPVECAYMPEELPKALKAVWMINDPIRACLHWALYLSGVRGGGLRTALKDDFLKAEGVLLIRNHKGKPFRLPLSKALISLFDTVIAIAKAHGDPRITKSKYLFPAFSEEGCIIDARAPDVPAPLAFAAWREERDRKEEGIRTHVWRHTYKTLAPLAGISDGDCRALMDHAGVQDAHSRYGLPLIKHLQTRQEVMSRKLLELAGRKPNHIFDASQFKGWKDVRKAIRREPALAELV